MSVQAVIGGEQWTELATNRGWGDFIRWVDLLPSDEYFYLTHLTDWGWTHSLDSLIEELEDALGEHPPAESVKTIAYGLLSILKEAGDSVSVLISDGLTSAEQSDGEWWIKDDDDEEEEEETA